ncbi:MAG: cytochrome c family protein [Bradyrhizobiaceae bacterium PARB1]|jgi:cytochrome c|uniref:c-type cytochrome n=1 Tax=Tardiphaga sp. TaxID=1926292 RepID=UPI000BDA75A1|nr:MAG: cytochrome c family protein [Bradyrhizobiaceae bacterium PARB1]
MLRSFVAAALFAAASSSALAQDVDAGKRVFNKCVACHAVGPGAANKVGPELNGLIGRKAGSVAGYNYSDANKSSGIVWTEQEFAAYIRDPKAVVKGTKMAFAGLKNDKEIADITAYLKTFAADGKTQ